MMIKKWIREKNTKRKDKRKQKRKTHYRGSNSRAKGNLAGELSFLKEHVDPAALV